MAAPIIRRRDNIATANGTASPACSFGSLPSAGSTIVVAWASWKLDTTYTHNSVADNQGGTYTQIGTTLSIGDGGSGGALHNRLSLWRRDNISAPSGTFTVTGTASQSCDSRVAVVEYAGVLTSTLDQTNQASSLTGTTATATLATTTNAQDMIVGAVSSGVTGTVVMTPNPTNLPWLVRENLDNGASQSLGVAERWVGETGAYTGSWTVSSGQWGAIVAAIKGDTWAGPYPVGAGTAVFTASNGATLTPTLPTGWAADDIHVLIAHRSDNTAMTTLANWTQISAANNTAGQRVEVWVRRAVGGDGNPTITFGSSTTVRGAQIVGIRGVDTGLTLSAIQLSRSDNAASATVTFATLTPTPANTLILSLFAYEDDPTAATPLSLGNGFAVSVSALGNDMALGWGAVGWPSASSATGAQTSTISGGTFANSPNVGLLVALPPASSGVTGTGAITIGAPAVASSGTFTTTGTGAPSILKPVLAGSGTAFDGPVSGTGALSIGAPVLAATGSFATTGTGAISIGTPALAATGSFATTGTGALSIAAPVLTATGTFTPAPVTGTGDTSIAAPALSGAGTFTTTGAAAVSIAAPVLDGTGSATDPGTGSGAVSIAGPSLAGSGTFTTTGSGAVAVLPPALAAAGTFTTTGAGAVSISPPVLAGTGAFTTVGTGAVSIGAPILDGTGSVADPGTGSGAISIDGPTLAGAGTFTPEAITGTGAVSVAGPQIQGTGSFATTGAGAATIGPPVLAGTGSFTILTITGTGSIAISAPGLAGVGTLAYVGTGAITIGPPSVNGYSVLATRAAASDAAYTGATASDAAYLGAGAGDLALAGAASSDSEV